MTLCIVRPIFDIHTFILRLENFFSVITKLIINIQLKFLPTLVCYPSAQKSKLFSKLLNFNITTETIATVYSWTRVTATFFVIDKPC